MTWGEPSYGEAEDALNRAVEGECEAAAQANAYYAFDLKTYAVNPTHYTIRHGLQDGRRRLQNWHLQVRRKRRQRKWIREREREKCILSLCVVKTIYRSSSTNNKSLSFFPSLILSLIPLPYRDQRTTVDGSP